MSVVRTERGLDRLVNFSDATVAIAITLLILPLVDAGPAVVRHGLGPYLNDNFWQFLAFVISFVVIARFWMVHHGVFERVENYSTTLVWLNFLWLASIVFIPFTANALSDSGGDHPEIYGLYVGNMLLTALAMQSIEVVIARSPRLASAESRQQLDLLRGFSFAILMAVALVLVVTLPKVGMYWLLILFLARPVYLALRALTRRPSQTRR